MKYFLAFLSKLIFLGVFPLTILFPALSAQSSMTLSAEQDNTLYESAVGDISNGKGESLFIGRNNMASNSIRRSLIQFNLQGLQGMGVVDSIALSFSINRSSDTMLSPISLHLVEKAWGEGNSDAPGSESEGDSAQPYDASWIYAFYDSIRWDNPGGDFEARPSAVDTLDVESRRIFFSSTEMLADISNALQMGDSSISWIMLGDESRNQSSRKIASRENADQSLRPELFLRFEPANSRAEKLKNHIQIYPNPLSGDQLFIEAEQLRGKDLSLTLMNLAGSIVYQKELRNFDPKESLTLTLSQGLYLIRIWTESEFSTQKLFIK